MSRATRVEFEGAYYHVMSRGVARMPTFLDDDDRRIFLDGVGDLVERGVLEVHAFCLMPNHYHLLARTPRGDLARWMRHVNGDYGRRFNVRHRRVGHVWQGRYKAIVVEDGRYFLECSRYIHLNPNRAKMTRPAERYGWSSYRNYVGGPKAVRWVETGPTLREVGGSREKYRSFVEAGKGEKAVSPFERATAGLVLGGEEFVRKVRGWLKGKAQTPDQHSLRALRWEARASPERVVEAVERAFPDAGPARKRRLILYAQRLYSRLRPMEIARRYERSHTAVALAVRELTARAKREPPLAAGLTTLAEALSETNG